MRRLYRVLHSRVTWGLFIASGVILIVGATVAQSVRLFMALITCGLGGGSAPDCAGAEGYGWLILGIVLFGVGLVGFIFLWWRTPGRPSGESSN